MQRKMLNPGIRGAGALECHAERLDGSDNSPNRLPGQQSARTDEMLVRLGDRLRRSGLSAFEAGFIKSILRQAKRGGPRWAPSARQLHVMGQILERPADDDDEPLIEEAEE